MILPEFDFVTFNTLKETLSLLNRYGNESKLIAGGTDLMIKLKSGAATPKYIVNLSSCEGLNYLKDNNGKISIGPIVTHTELVNSSLLNKFAPVLSAAAGVIGSPQIRNQGTIGGNICNASPSADTVPALMVLNSKVKIVSHDEERWTSLKDFFLSPHHTILKGNELIAEIEMEKLPEDTLFSFQRVSRRKSMDIAQMSVAVALVMDENKGHVLEARISPGSVTPTPVRIHEAEKILEGEILTDNIIESAAEEVSRRAIDMADTRWIPEYKKPAIKGLVIRTIKDVMGQRGQMQ
ncbi:MAG: xanthine dehydrogenase family protein subunit M [Thermodesulfobacteriota bacterium]|nr:xanthine dehydrogenase family protein subunit M [Thermodesulfobacteriota bacterium]